MQKCKRVVYCSSRANRRHIITYTKIKALRHVKEQIFWDSWKGCVSTSSSLLPRSTIFQRTMQTHCRGLQRFNGVKTCIILGLLLLLLLFSLFLFALLRLYLEIGDIWRPGAGLAGKRDSMVQIRDIPGNPGGTGGNPSHWSLHDTRCYFNVHSKADMSRLNLPHGAWAMQQVRGGGGRWWRKPEKLGSHTGSK